MNHGGGIRLVFHGQTMAAGILSFPELADGFRRLTRPIKVSQPGDQLHGAKEFHRVGIRPAVRSGHR